MKIAYKALYNKALEEKRFISDRMDELIKENILRVEENKNLKDKVEQYAGTAVISILVSIINCAVFYWINK